MFGPGWNHMVDVYEPAAQDPVIGNAWKTAPVQFEVCGVMQDWYDRGFDIDLILRKGLEWHCRSSTPARRRSQPRGDHAWTSF